MEFCSGSVSLFHKRRHATTAAFRSTSGTIILNSAHVYLFVGVNVHVYLSLCARARVCVCVGLSVRALSGVRVVPSRGEQGILQFCCQDR